LRKSKRETIKTISWISLTALLLFPYIISNWNPALTYLERSYYEQQNNVTKHIENNISEIQSDWKQNISQNISNPVISIIPTKIENAKFFQLSSWNKIIDYLGYNNYFFLGIGNGWCFALSSSLLFILGNYLLEEDLSVKKLIIDLKFITTINTFIIAFLILVIIIENMMDYHIDSLYSRGKFEDVLLKSNLMIKTYPLVKGDKDFIKRFARAKNYDEKGDNSLNLFLNGIENYEKKNYGKAEVNFNEALRLEPKRFLIRGYLASTLLNQGQEYMNLKNQDPGKVIDLCERALKIFPGHIEALYYLMIENVRIGNFEKSATFAEKIIKESKYFQQPSITLLGQSYLHLAWNNYANDKIDESWSNYIKSINQAKWKE
jgi:hypothetical protein